MHEIGENTLEEWILFQSQKQTGFTGSDGYLIYPVSGCNRIYAIRFAEKSLIA
jgi:hypothetical protein